MLSGLTLVADQTQLVVADAASPFASLPAAGNPGGIAFGGQGRDELFVAVGGRVFGRKTRARGVFPFEAPVKSNAPRL
jgi:hypothetical protein